MNQQTLHRIESNKIYQKSALVNKPNVYTNQENGKHYIKLKLLKFDAPTVNGRIYPRENSIEIKMKKTHRTELKLTIKKILSFRDRWIEKLKG